MYSTRCLKCYKEFSRRDAMLRHFRQKHGQKVNASYPPPPPLGALSPPPPLGAPPPPPPPPPHLERAPPPPHLVGMPLPPPKGVIPQGQWMTPQSEGVPLTLSDSIDTKELRPMILYHPFTMMVSGPTACGKTTFVKSLLQKNSTRIQPTIQRIVWQPLYDIIRTTVVPKVKFVKGIPVDLEDDDYFDPKVNNLLILDVLFSEAGKDKRITDLFTEGSHHRSLSVISINQNLFTNKDPTQRRNCHYLVIFNNPVDRQTMLTFARQMYPSNTEIFQKAFTKATKNPYGYLLMDLKPFTSENDRLKYAIDWPGII